MKQYKIAFLSNKLTLRGTEVSLFDYADYNEKILNNTSIIITRNYNDVSDNRDANIEAYNKFNNRFPVYYYKSIQSIETIIQENSIDIIFIEKAGSPSDELLFNSCKTIIHSVFTLEEPHGDAYTSLSEWLNIHHNTNYDNIHYMVRVFDCLENLRDELSIPNDAIVYGTYSGADCFNIDYIKKCVTDLSKQDNNIYYIFLNIIPFCQETKYVRFLKGTSDMRRKRMFINTCDAMLYGRDGGETFGLSCGEFSICNKPVIARSNEHSSSHLYILGDKIIKHSNYNELYSILTNWNKYKIDVRENGYKKFTPEYCMNEFNSVIKKLFKYTKTIKVYFHGFWPGFFEKTNPVHIDFFKNLLEDIFESNIILGAKEDSDILFETVFEKSIIEDRTWKFKFLFSGESRISDNYEKYDVVLCSKKNKKNIVNVPLFIPYLYSNYSIEYLENFHKISKQENKCHIPITSIISNPNCNDRNILLQILMSKFPVANFGNIMNNTGQKIPYQYNTKDFTNFIKQFSFIFACENSVDETYITEKVFHGLLSNSIPIYYGSPNITDYINKDRILIIEKLEEKNIQKLINKIDYLSKNKDAYTSMIKQPIFTNGTLFRKREHIIKDIKRVLFQKNGISNIYCLCNKEYEPERFKRINAMFKSFNWIVDYVSPTYKHTITKEIYDTYVRTDEIFTLRSSPIKKAEVSIMLNFIEELRTIRKNYSSGIFLTLESDVYLHGDIKDIEKIISVLNKHNPLWSCVHIGYDKSNLFYDYDIFDNGFGLKRKFNPKCTDSFIWTYDGVIQILNYIENKINLEISIPLDYIFWNFLKESNNFYFYWSNPTVFIQGSNAGMEESTIQNDLS